VLVGDLDLEELTVRSLSDLEPKRNSRVAGETPIAPLPQLLGTDTGGLAARGFESDLHVDVYLLGGGSFSGGIFGQPLAFNELYKLTLRPDEDGNYLPDGGWQFVADYADGIAGIPNNGVVPLTGLASLGDSLYSIDASGFFFDYDDDRAGDRDIYGLDRHVDIVDLEIPSSGGAASFHTISRIPMSDYAAEVFGLNAYRFAIPTALDGANERGTIFASITGIGENNFGADPAPTVEFDLGWAAQFFNGLRQFEQDFGFLEIDPRTNYLARSIYYGTGPTGSHDDTVDLYTVGNPSTLDGLAYEDGQLVLTGSSGYYDYIDDSYGFGRYFLRIDPDTGEIMDFEPEPTGVEEDPRAILGLAGSNYGDPPPSVPLAPQASGFDSQTIDPIFASMAYSAQSIGLVPSRGVNEACIEIATPLAAIYTLHIVNTALDPEAAARSIELDRIPKVLADHIDQVGGIGAATFDLRDPLPPGHPAAGADSDRALDVEFVGLTEEYDGGYSGGFATGYERSDELFTTLGNRDLRSPSIDDAREDWLPSYLYDEDVEGGLTSREHPDGSSDRLLYGGVPDVGERGASDEYVVAYNEVYEIDAGSSEPSWTFLGKFLPEDYDRDGSGGSYWEPGDAYYGNDWPLLTGLSALDSDDYAISHDARIFRLHYPSQGSYEGTLEEVADLRWDRGGALATAESRGSLFAVGQFEGTELPVSSGLYSALSDLVVYEVDPRNSFVKDSWWGFNGDFQTGLATSWGSFDSWQGPQPTEVISIDGAAFVEGGDSGTLVIAGEFGFASDENQPRSNAKGKKSKSRHNGSARSFTEYAYLSINVGADGSSRNPYLMRIDYNEGSEFADSGWIGLASRADDTSADAAPPITLSPATGPMDFDTLGAGFSRMSYSSDALRTGALQQVFASEFAKSVPGYSKEDLLYNPLLQQALEKFAGQENGIAQASAFLQDALGEGSAAQTGGAIEAGVPYVGPDPKPLSPKEAKKQKKAQGKKISGKERRATIEKLRREYNKPRAKGQ